MKDGKAMSKNKRDKKKLNKLVLFDTEHFLISASFLTKKERGEFITLLCRQHLKGAIPESHMITVCGSLESPVVNRFVRDENGNYYNKQMRIESEKRSKYSESRRQCKLTKTAKK